MLARALVVIGALAAHAAGAQSPESPVATTVAAIRADPARLHLRWVVVSGTVSETGPRRLLIEGPDAVEFAVAGPVPRGPVEVTGQVIDIGRLRARERQTTLPGETAPLTDIYGRRWPARGAVVVVAATRVSRITPSPSREATRPFAIESTAPAQDETDVRLDARIRLQFSRPLDAVSLDGRIRMQYSAQESIERGEPSPPRIDFTVSYHAELNAVTIQPTQPLERFREVIVDVLPGVTGEGGTLGRAWTLQFVTGGS